jgi:hypothetical protein
MQADVGSVTLAFILKFAYQEWIRSHKEFWVQKYFLAAPVLGDIY